MLTIHRQTWLGIKRHLIFNEHGSVILDIFDTPRRGVKALIWSLWVQPDHRRQGLATALMNTAEEIARREGLDAVHLEWHPKEATQATLHWYYRRGYTTDFTALDDTKRLKLQLK